MRRSYDAEMASCDGKSATAHHANHMHGDPLKRHAQQHNAHKYISRIRHAYLLIDCQSAHQHAKVYGADVQFPATLRMRHLTKTPNMCRMNSNTHMHAYIHTYLCVLLGQPGKQDVVLLN